MTDDEDLYNECEMFGAASRAQTLFRISLALQRSRGLAEKMIFITAISPMLIKPITWTMMAFWLLSRAHHGPLSKPVPSVEVSRVARHAAFGQTCLLTTSNAYISNRSRASFM